MKIKKIDAAWLAGLIEGEGTFFYDAPRNRFVVQIVMSDQDVVAKAAEIMGVSVVGPYKGSSKATYKHKKLLYLVRVRGGRAEAVMRAIYPHMGQRRREKIDSFLGT